MLLKCVHVIKNRPGLPHDERVMKKKKTESLIRCDCPRGRLRQARLQLRTSAGDDQRHEARIQRRERASVGIKDWMNGDCMARWTEAN